MSNQYVLDAVSTFLIRRRWASAGERGLFHLYAPPEELGFEDDFKLAVPKRVELPDFSRSIDGLIEFLADVYQDPIEDLNAILIDGSTVFSTRIADEEVQQGVIRFDRFDALLRKLKGILLHAANYVATEDPLLSEATPLAQAYLRSCAFMQTQKGSFITRVKMPREKKIAAAADLFGASTISAGAVSERVKGVIGFVSNELLDGKEEWYDEQFIEQNRHLVNIPLLKSVTGLFEDTGLTNWDFTFSDAESTTEIHPGKVTTQQLRQVNAYIEFVRTKLKEQTLINVEGMVIELRSRNPKKHNNAVRMDAFLNYRQINLLVYLDRERYEAAVKAHMSGKLVRVRGYARKMQTQYRIDSAEAFEIIDR